MDHIRPGVEDHQAARGSSSEEVIRLAVVLRCQLCTNQHPHATNGSENPVLLTNFL